MGDATSIEWTDATWNPVRGCSRVSKGCENCYAEGVARRFSGPGQPYEGLVRLDRDGKAKAQWNGTVRIVPEHLADPLRWTRPRRVFVNSMSDLFHEALRFEDIAAIFGVMAVSPNHTFQVLTKRPERAREFFAWAHRFGELRSDALRRCRFEATRRGAHILSTDVHADGADWPLPNVWLGVSVEDQQSADERIPHLLACPASVRFVSYEPALGPVVFARQWLRERPERRSCLARNGRWGTCVGCPDSLGRTYPERETIDVRPEKCPNFGRYDHRLTATEGSALDWVIVGGESGPGARPFDLAWARSVVTQCREAGTKCFVKQLGAQPIAVPMEGPYPRTTAGGDTWPAQPIRLRDRKGGDMREWPEDLWVRDVPEVQP